jgi:hypothetical protein
MLKPLPTIPMKPFSEYSAEELAMERLFIRWIRNPNDGPIRSFWENWLKKFPEMQGTVDTARELVQKSSDWFQEPVLTTEETNSLWGRIRSSIEQVKEMEPLQSRLDVLKIRLFYYRWYVVSFLVLLFLVWAILS